MKRKIILLCALLVLGVVGTIGAMMNVRSTPRATGSQPETAPPVVADTPRTAPNTAAVDSTVEQSTLRPAQRDLHAPNASTRGDVKPSDQQRNSNPRQATAPVTADAARRPPADGPRFRGHDTFTLMRLFRGIGRLIESEDHALTAEQARKILAIVTPLRTQATLTPEGAKEALSKLEAVLTKEQREMLAQAPPRRGPGGGEGPRPDGERRRPEGRPDGAAAGERGGEGGPPRDRPRGERPEGAGNGLQGRQGMPGGGEMTNFNPFRLPEGDDPRVQRMAERLQAAFDALEARANAQ